MTETALVVIPSFTPALSLVADSVRSPHSKRAYRAALTDFLGWRQTSGTAEFSKAAVQEYRSALEQRNLSPSSIKLQMSAIRRLAAEMADNGLLDPQTALVISKVKGPHRNGVRLGNWLSLRQAEISDRKLKDDGLFWMCFLGAGLQRSELSALRLDHLQQREGAG